MHSVVCIKQVPDTTEVRIDPRTNTLVREGVPAIVNPDDLHALEAALRVKEQHGGRVTVISMGPPQAEKALRRALGLGADRAVLLSDRAFAAADTYATTHVLALAIRRIGVSHPVDLVWCGRQALDGDTGQVGPGLARRLGLPLLAYATAIRSVDPSARRIVVERRLDTAREVLEAPLPALVTVDGAINEVRYAPLPAMLRALQEPVAVWGAADIGADPEDVGLRGSPTKVVRSFVPAGRRGRVQLIPGGEAEPARAAAILADRLIEAGVVPVRRAPAPAVPEGGREAGREEGAVALPADGPASGVARRAQGR